MQMAETTNGQDEPRDVPLDAPGPDSFQAPSIRRWITLSYWTIILLCIPYWWHSTTIERHTLPLVEIEKWQNRGACPLQLPVSLSFSLENSESVCDTDGVVNGLNRISQSSDRCLVFRETKDSSTTSCHIKLGKRGASISEVQSNSSVSVDGRNVTNAVASLANLFMPSPNAGPSRRPQFSQSSKAGRYAPKYKLVFSLLNENIGKGGIKKWEIDSALRHYIYPLLGSLEDLHEYDVESQIQYYAPLNVQMEFKEDGAIIAEDQLKAFVNSAEWNLASSVSSDPVLHLILYVPSSDKKSLNIRRANGTEDLLTFFTIPQWGGVVIHNEKSILGEDTAQKVELTQADLKAAFSSFASFLRASHGVPTLESTTGPREVVASWEVQALMRERTVQNIQDAIQKLGAIARQVNEIQNMRIPKAVQEDVKSALAALASIESDDVKVAMRQSAKASSLATRASFNHEMLAMLYFPDEHKWAVYTPLFGPIAVPLLVALLREIKEYQKRRRENSKQE